MNSLRKHSWKETFKKSFIKSKRGQAEIIGLAIVVIILLFALVFFVKMKASEKGDESKLIRSNLRANSALNALMKVNVNEKQMKELIVECFENDPRSCEASRGNLTFYLNELFENQEFNLTIYEGNSVFQDLTLEIGKDCDEGISASPFLIRHVANSRAEFKVCS